MRYQQIRDERADHPRRREEHLRVRNGVLHQPAAELSVARLRHPADGVENEGGGLAHAEDVVEGFCRVATHFSSFSSLGTPGSECEQDACCVMEYTEQKMATILSENTGKVAVNEQIPGDTASHQDMKFACSLVERHPP